MIVINLNLDTIFCLLIYIVSKYFVLRRNMYLCTMYNTLYILIRKFLIQYFGIYIQDIKFERMEYSKVACPQFGDPVLSSEFYSCAPNAEFIAAVDILRKKINHHPKNSQLIQKKKISCKNKDFKWE